MKEIELFTQLLGEHLRRRRKEYGFSIQKVAEHADTGVDHLGRIERGKKQPTAYTLFKLCNYLNIDSNKIYHEIAEELKENKSN